MEKYKLFHELRGKKDKTQTEEMLLNYNKILTIISEILVDESKMHLNPEDAIEKIRDCIRENA